MASLDRVYERGENPVLEEVRRHVETMVGPVAAVVPDPAPADPAIDVVMVEPTPARPYRTLVTSGMSARPGAVPIGWGDCRYTELALALPRDWPWAAGPGGGKQGGRAGAPGPRPGRAGRGAGARAGAPAAAGAAAAGHPAAAAPARGRAAAARGPTAAAPARGAARAAPRHARPARRAAAPARDAEARAPGVPAPAGDPAAVVPAAPGAARRRPQAALRPVLSEGAQPPGWMFA